MRVYIAGPMAGKPNLNFPLFAQKAQIIRARGHEALNPVEIGKTHFGDELRPAHDFLVKDILELVTCDAIMLLPDWEKSCGATYEAVIAKTLGLLFFDPDGDEMAVPPEILCHRTYGPRT